MPGRSRTVRAALLALALALVACGEAPRSGPSTGPGHAGPLTGGQGATRICVPVEADGTLTIGHDILRNGGREDITVTDVALTGSNGIRLIDAVLVELTGPNAVGLRNHPPDPAELDVDGLTEDWAARQPIGEAVIPAPAGGEPAPYNLVVTVGSDRSVSSSDGVDVRYTSGGDRWTLHLLTSLELRTPPDSCRDASGLSGTSAPRPAGRSRRARPTGGSDRTG